MVVAFAGRRVDAPNAATVHFPSSNTETVRRRIQSQLVSVAARAIVSSAACGADLLALNAAGELGMRRVIVLPWDRDRFRATSVVDRGGEWGPVFDRVLDDVSAHGDLRILGYEQGDDAAYAATNESILDAAQDLARETNTPADVAAIVAWNRESRGPSDLTEHFMSAARGRGMRVIEVGTV